MNRVLSCAAIAIAAGYLFLTSRIVVPAFGGPIDATAFPRLLGIALILAAILLFIEDRREKRIQGRQRSAASGFASKPVLVGGIVLVTACYFLMFEPLGYIISTTIYLLVLTPYFHRGKWVANISVSIAFPIVSYLVLSKLLGLALPAGPLL